MVTVSQFEKMLRNATKNIPIQVNKVIADTTLAIQSTLIDTTPVKTGKAKTNWRIYTSDTSPEELPAPVSPNIGITEAKTQGKSVVNANPKAGVFYVINSAGYIQKLDSGWSMQAPSNFVRISIQAVIEQINKNPHVIVELK